MKRNDTIFNRDNRMISKTLSRRDNMLVENERFTIYRRPVRDGMWESLYLEMFRMGLNMNNSLQAERRAGKMGEGTNGRKGEGNKLQTETCPLVHLSTNFEYEF